MTDNQKQEQFFKREGMHDMSHEELSVIFAFYHCLFCNELTVQFTINFYRHLKKHKLYRFGIKHKADRVYQEADRYEKQIQRIFATMERQQAFANMADYIDEAVGNDIKQTQYSLRLALGRNGIKDDELFAEFLMLKELMHSAEAVYDAEYKATEHMVGGIIKRTTWAKLDRLAKLVVELQHELLAGFPEKIEYSDTLNIEGGFKAIHQKMNNPKTIAKAFNSI